MSQEQEGFARIITIPATEEHVTTVVFLHGLGQNVELWNLELQALAQKLPSVKWVLPQARLRPVSLNHGMLRHSWFDIRHLPPFLDEFDEACITESIGLVEQLILTEVHAGIRSRKILLAGFSQGASLALMVALTTLHDLGGVASLSGWIPHRIRDQIVHNDPHLPVFWGLGHEDTEIPFRYGRNSIEFLEETVKLPPEMLTIKEYDGLGHETSEAELDDFRNWIVDAMNTAYETDSGSA